MSYMEHTPHYRQENDDETKGCEELALTRYVKRVCQELYKPVTRVWGRDEDKVNDQHDDNRRQKSEDSVPPEGRDNYPNENTHKRTHVPEKPFRQLPVRWIILSQSIQLVRDQFLFISM